MNQPITPESREQEHAPELGSASDASLLFIGEIAVGKCRAARAMHDRSAQREAPFAYLNCGALGDQVTSDRLFADVRAGATRSSDAAGTLYLARIECLAPEWQARVEELLRAAPRYRLMAGARVESERALAACLSPELYRRFGSARVRLAPLRDRTSEIIPAAVELLSSLNSPNRAPPRLTPAAAVALLTYDWPGNFLELKNAMCQASLLSETCVIERVHLPETVVPRRQEWHFGELTEKVRLGLVQLERSAVAEALRASGGNRAKAARALGVTARAVEYRAAKYGVSPVKVGR